MARRLFHCRRLTVGRPVVNLLHPQLPLDQPQQLLGVDRLEQEIHHAQVHGIDRVAYMCVARDNDDRHRRPSRIPDLPDQIQSVARRHPQIGDQQRNGGPGFQQVHGTGAASSGYATDVVEAQDFGKDFSSILVVIHDQHSLWRLRWRGKHYLIEGFALFITQNVVIEHTRLIFPSTSF